ncbi:hypothetical protein L7F22_048445 [Adiantum nelumboides]|nr:hypothetical protein [Adiantum nelumboides]
MARSKKTARKVSFEDLKSSEPSSSQAASEPTSSQAASSQTKKQVPSTKTQKSAQAKDPSTAHVPKDPSTTGRCKVNLMMSMASMMQLMCAPSHEHLEGPSAAAAAAFNIFSPQPANLDCAPLLLINTNSTDAANPFTWQPSKTCSPPLEGPFTPVPHSIPSDSLHPELHGDHLHEAADEHEYSFLSTIAANLSYSDLLSLNASQLPSTGLGMEEWRLAAEEMQLSSQRKLSCMYRSPVGYGDTGVDDTLSNEASGMGGSAANGGQSRSLILEGSDDEDVKLSHLARFVSNGSTCGEISSSVTTTTTTPACSGGQQSKAKVVQVKSELVEIAHCQNWQERALPVSTTKGSKQSRKRSAIASSTITSLKTPRMETPPDVVHVRARRGQATDSHSLAERVRREKISQRMKVLQEIVPGCHKVLGKAMMLDEIINYVKSLQRQVEFLSMKLAVANHAGIASMIIDKANYTPSHVEIFGDPTNSHLQLMQLEHVIASMMQ